jgi:hypothetical protein
MDDIDALFRSSSAGVPAAAPQGASRGGPPQRSGQSGDPWVNGGQATPHPLDAEQPRLAGPRAAPRAPVVAQSGVRSQVRQVCGVASGGAEQGERGAAGDRAPEDDRGGWSGGEEERPVGGDARGPANERDFYSVHIYGGKAALCFQADTTRSGREGETNTVRLEAAPSRVPRTYNWSEKIAVQFTVKELPMVLAVFMGWMPSVTFKAHGPQQDKGFSMEHQQGGKMFVKVWQAKTAMAVPLYAQDMYAVVALLLRQMSKNQAFMGVEGVLAVVRQLSSVYQEAGLGVQPMPARSAA